MREQNKNEKAKGWLSRIKRGKKHLGVER